MAATHNPERLTAWILVGIAAMEGIWVAVNFAHSPKRFIAYLGFTPAGIGAVRGWLIAAAVVAAFVRQSAQLPSVRANLLRPSLLKIPALAVAAAAGILEEVIFRKWLMDYLLAQEIGAVLQVLASGLAFGLMHGVWGLMGRSFRAALRAMTATGLLGLGLGLVYIGSGRSLAPCIAAHFLINALIEPGLMLAATRGEMGRHR